MDNWYRFKDKKPPVGVEVDFYNKHWVCPDFNPNGIRSGFLTDEVYVFLALWVDHQDTYTNLVINPLSPDYPTHWQPKPTPPKD